MQRIKDFGKREYSDLISGGNVSGGVGGNQKKDEQAHSGGDLEDKSQNSKSFFGRWTSKEHARFLEGLNLFGKDWRKIEEFIGTRTGAQIRSHAQKYYLKLDKQKSKQREKQFQKVGGGECLVSRKSQKREGKRKSDQSECSSFLNENENSSVTQISSPKNLPLLIQPPIQHTKNQREFNLSQPATYINSEKQPALEKTKQFQNFTPPPFTPVNHHFNNNSIYNNPLQLNPLMMLNPYFGMQLQMQLFNQNENVFPPQQTFINPNNHHNNYFNNPYSLPTPTAPGYFPPFKNNANYLPTPYNHYPNFNLQNNQNYQTEENSLKRKMENLNEKNENQHQNKKQIKNCTVDSDTTQEPNNNNNPNLLNQINPNLQN